MGTGTLILALTLGMAVGQPEPYYLRERNIQIPIKVQPEKRGDLKELILFVSKDLGKSWNMAALAKPDDASFPYHAPADGQFWFKVQWVEKSGVREPADIYAAPVNMKVVIDSQRQLLRIVSADRVGEEVQVVWETVGAQPDLMTLKLEYRSADLGPNAPWQPVPLDPSANGQKRFKPVSAGAIAIKMQVSDQSGAPAVVVKELPAAVAAAPVFAPVANTNPVVAAAPVAQVQQSTSNNSTASSAPAIPFPAPVAPGDVPNPTPGPVNVPPAAAPPAITPPAEPAPAGAPTLTPLPSAQPGAESPARVAGPSAAPGPPFGGAPPATRPEMPAIEHVRDNHVALDFELDRTGPSGVKKIEVYITDDDGRSWHQWKETYETKPPLQLPLPPTPHERTFGFKLVPYSGVLQSIGAPKPGDPPDIRLHVDRTAPKVEWYPIQPDPSIANAVTLRYRCSDANLAPTGVGLFWATNQAGPWQPIQSSNTRPVTGYSDVQDCTWMLPPDLPNKVYLKISARDLAGNVGERVTRDPVTLDLHKPTARVKGILTARPAQSAPGNPPSLPPFGGLQP